MVRRRLEILENDYFPAYVVWELTLACDQPCAHCGSRAGKAREQEVTLVEALKIVKELKEMRTQEVVLIGGEAYLHEDFFAIVRALKAAGIRAGMTTGGRGITPELAVDMKEAGVHAVSVSIDGLEKQHDGMRRLKGGFQSALQALDNFKAAGILIASNININRINAPVLEELYALLKAKGIRSWQVQITVPLGRAADRPQMLLQPWELLNVVPRLEILKRQAFKDGIILMPGNNLGYFGPEEALMRSVKEGGSDHWQGCQAGKRVLGIESDTSIKGCPSLQSSHYIGGKQREQSIKEIWETSTELNIIRERTVDDLWGFCRECVFAEQCMGGCTFTAHSVFEKAGNNPYCHFRAMEMKKRGQRERLVPVKAASGLPFDNGSFKIVIEDFDETFFIPQVEDLEGLKRLVQITRKAQKLT